MSKKNSKGSKKLELLPGIKIVNKRVIKDLKWEQRHKVEVTVTVLLFMVIPAILSITSLFVEEAIWNILILMELIFLQKANY